MPHPIELHTQRLLLRQWRASDLKPFAQMNACAKVMKYFPQLLTEYESNAIANKLADFIDDKGWGFWAVEEKQSNQFIGFTGLKQAPECLPFSPAVEIGWRFDSQYWHKGYATEAAKKSLEFAFNELKFKEVISFTAKVNKPSEKVMQRIGMENTEITFNHPLVNINSPLREHILYTITAMNITD
ncbi:GNAT family N-acetyltransferase [Colwellia sp. UCD-KL20]|uniref:GNAT family N-acetyltransferase n=1 Tax=Colwellia sp. UCD-KL20 TaxID=1917165 RepID=UPI00097045B1|nr:GNAT family N-acetyltransferase [Colwellia sp. UCD-KL20]